MDMWIWSVRILRAFNYEMSINIIAAGVIANLYQWRSAEIIVIILVGCIPTWGPVINRYVRKIKALRFVPSRECFRPRPDPFGEGTSTTLRTVSQAHAKQGMPESWIDLDYNHAIRSANNAIRVDQTIEISNEVA
ncbi:MAG: hypothetical protein M1822_005061 [Bathelium mastoideum]|nr:MAG: hypothetical protein M1822_005061 [Bathelium mastoideum]